VRARVPRPATHSRQPVKCPECETILTVPESSAAAEAQAHAASSAPLSAEEVREVWTEPTPEARTAEEPKTGGLFKRRDYIPFMIGVFVIGGLVGLPLTYGLALGLGYLAALPWALGSCAVILVAFRQNGTIAWWRAVPAMAGMVVVASAYQARTQEPAFVAGGFAGFIGLAVCGYLGVGIGRLFRRKSK